jgi:hypothetical protein
MHRETMTKSPFRSCMESLLVGLLMHLTLVGTSHGSFKCILDVCGTLLCQL